MHKELYRTKHFTCAVAVEKDGSMDVLFTNRRLRAMRYLPSGDGGSDVLKLLAAVANTPNLLDTALCLGYWRAFEPGASAAEAA
ncbi:hypothetical protein GGQ85_000738 [Nitrobacter vulgaris]|uniref:hypothetical protein n=1 Tax=Nitrobacter vulgaris TaxID=29421 RepID=UPI0028562A76|nr:hypothetical protein [Nitrobacter vulgaris]MDR6303057.1 hypothetical protein [Nitrobacter vulgaris]